MDSFTEIFKGNNIDNKVTLTLTEFLDLYEKAKLSNKVTDTIVNIILNGCELTSNKEDLVLDAYNMKYGKILDTIKRYFPEEYKNTLEYLKKEDNE